ncbi:MAG: hypothetical protein ACD_9C00200G0013, partial [uncultured bacterium]
MSKKKIKVIAYLIVLLISSFFVAEKSKAATNTGVTTSPIYDATRLVNFSDVIWNETIPSLTSIVMEVKIGSNADLSDAAWVVVSNGQSLSSYVGKRYFQYRATLSSDDLNSAPSLDNVAFNYSYYPSFTVDDSYTKLLLHGDGIGSAFVDSATGKSVTAIGNTTQSNTQLKFGEKSIYFDGSGDSLQMNSNADWEMGSTWTIDAWIRPSAWKNATYNTFYSYVQGGATPRWLQIFINNTGQVFIGTEGNSNLWIDRTIALNQWSHLAIVSNNGLVNVYINGLSAGAAFSLTSTQAVGAEVKIGWDSGLDREFTGYMDEYRISKGVARWTNNFTVPNYRYGEYVLVSSPYDTSSQVNVFSKILWTENLPTNTDVKFQVRTSPDNLSWTSWMGIDGNSQSYFTSPDGSESLPAALSDSANDRWIQYKAFLSTTDTSVTPTISQVGMQYVVNAKPEFNSDFPTTGVGGVAASQQDTGEIKIDFSVRDPDAAG